MAISKQSLILVTGGAGFIGSHSSVVLLDAGYKVVIADNLSNSVQESVSRVKELTGAAAKNLIFIKGDLCDPSFVEGLFDKYKFDAVIHFAALKAVGESVEQPLTYYDNNLTGTINLLKAMTAHGCKQLVFSSSATVYGIPEKVPCTEDFPLGASNPYGRSKLFVEEILRDVFRSDHSWRIILLRYFNPVGAHPSGRIGEDPKGIPNNLMPFVQQVAVGRRKELTVFGHDYPTRDGTGVRDYIHVMDLADGHRAALDRLLNSTSLGCVAINLGTGTGTSVLEMVAAFEKACGKRIPYRLADRRPGDSPEVYGNVEKAERILGWRAKYGLEEMCAHQWNWAKSNPYGYAGSPKEAVGTNA